MYSTICEWPTKEMKDKSNVKDDKKDERVRPTNRRRVRNKVKKDKRVGPTNRRSVKNNAKREKMEDKEH